jgi:small basic protein
VKVVVGVIVAVFLGTWMVQAPDSLASVTSSAAAAVWDTTTAVFGGLRHFLTALFG